MRPACPKHRRPTINSFESHLKPWLWLYSTQGLCGQTTCTHCDHTRPMARGYAYTIACAHAYIGANAHVLYYGSLIYKNHSIPSSVETMSNACGRRYGKCKYGKRTIMYACNLVMVHVYDICMYQLHQNNSVQMLPSQ